MDNELKLLAFETAPVGLVMTEHRVVVACNHTFCELSQYSAGELVGQSFRKLYTTTAQFDAVRDIGVRALADQGSYTDQRLLRRKDGTTIWCRFRAHTLTPEDPLSRAVLSYAKLGNLPAQRNLTARERDVIMGLTRGLTSKRIAFELGLSARTIEDVRARLLKKFGVRNSSELLWHFTNVEV